MLVVGGVNVLRGFWTLVSHAMEGVGRPAVSFRTKLYGLAVSVPIPALFGAEFGAVAGAAGYGVMNLVVFAYVVYYARGVFGRVPVDAGVAARLVLGLVASSALTTAATAVLSGIVSPVAVAVVAAATCLVAFGGVLLAVSGSTRAVADRTVRLCRDGLRSLAR